ncbi:hypothetical protein C7M84_015605 [Penaeus vannamei]|uniref:Uncharacterized protein n=1 Tax=Penaeus vannamei TaxID=6689 RepID=A0A423SQ79_PENVA|nr:hypothetical protein C7M84_015605 [Penaeus vannamei]
MSHFVRASLTLDALDQAGRALRAEAHIMSLLDSLERRASFFHWSYPEVGGDGRCWVRVHATDRERHPCSTSHVRKHPALYPLLYPDLYPTGPPGPLAQRLQCDMTEFSLMDFDSALDSAPFVDETTPMCFEVRVTLAPASADRHSSEARAFLWHGGQARPVSGAVRSQLNGFFNYADVRDPTNADYPVFKLFLRALKYDITAVEGQSPLLRIGASCSEALEDLSKGKLKDSPSKGQAPPTAKEVGLSDLASIPHPVPNVCFPDLGQDVFLGRGNAYRVALRDQARLMDGQTRLVAPEPFYKRPEVKANNPLGNDYFNTYLSNDTSKFLTIAFQEPTGMFAEGAHSQLVGAARMERVDESGQYYVHALPFTVAHYDAYIVRSHVAAYRDANFGIMLYARVAHAFRKKRLGGSPRARRTTAPSSGGAPRPSTCGRWPASSPSAPAASRGTASTPSSPGTSAARDEPRAASRPGPGASPGRARGKAVRR